MKKRTAIAVLTLGLLAASLARADWHQAGGLTGGPIDTWIADAGGYFVVHTTNAASRLVFNGTGVIDAGSMSVSGPKCSAIGANGYLRVYTLTDLCNETPPAGCTTSTVASQVAGCRGTENLTAYGTGTTPLTAPAVMMYTDAGDFGREWLPDLSPSNPGNPAGNGAAVSAKSVFGHEYGLIPRNNAGGTFFIVDNVASPAPYFQQGLFTTARSEIFGTRDGGVRAVVVGGDGGQLMTLQPNGSIAATNFTLPPSVTGVFALRGATLSELEGDQSGAGFGMLMVDSPNAQVKGLWSAIPDPDNVGRFWVRSTAQPPAPSVGVYDSVRCMDARFCVLGSVTSASATNQLAIYQNVASPFVLQPAFTMREEDAVTHVLTVDAGDNDGDAVFLTWTPDSGTSTYFTTFTRDSSVLDGRTWLAVPRSGNSQLCGLDHVDLPLDVTASDGLNKTLVSGTVTVVHTRPGQPGPDQVAFVPAGTGQVTQTLNFISNGCLGLGTSVVTVPAGTPATVTLVPPVNPNSVTVAYTPPRTWCDDTPDSGAKDIRVQVVDGTVTSPVGTATFIVLPWGEPEPPFAAGAVVFQDAGTTVTYAPAATHLCAAASNFPGVTTHWSWVAGGAGFAPSVLLSDGGQFPPGGGADSPTVTVSVPDCQSGTITFQALNTTRGGGLSGSDAGLTVNVGTSLQPLSGTLTVTAVPEDAGLVSGTLDVSSVQCQSLRTLDGTVALYRDDGGFISSAVVSPVPNSYLLTAPGACGGGTFTVSATASDPVNGGMLGPATQNVDLPLLVPGFDQVQVSDFHIVCGDVARADASVTFLSTQCNTAQVDWTSTGAVAIVPTSGNPVVSGDPSVALATVSSDFGGLIGMPVTVTATATAETGMASKDAPTVLVLTEPFLQVVHRTDTAVASESRVMGVEVQLHNPTECDVSGVVWHETLEGLELIPGSVTGVDGGMDAGTDDGGVLVVPGLSLPKGQTVTFRYSARPTLFGDPSPAGTATLRGVPISDPSGLSGGNPTCGCQSGSSGVTALAGLLAAALLRKRRVRARS